MVDQRRYKENQETFYIYFDFLDLAEGLSYFRTIHFHIHSHSHSHYRPHSHPYSHSHSHSHSHSLSLSLSGEGVYQSRLGVNHGDAARLGAAAQVLAHGEDLCNCDAVELLRVSCRI